MHYGLEKWIECFGSSGRSTRAVDDLIPLINQSHKDSRRRVQSKYKQVVFLSLPYVTSHRRDRLASSGCFSGPYEGEFQIWRSDFYSCITQNIL